MTYKRIAAAAMAAAMTLTSSAYFFSGSPQYVQTAYCGSTEEEAVTAEQDGLTFTIEDGQAVCTGMAKDSSRKAIVIPASVTADGKEFPVAGIADKAFELTDITSVVISDGVKSIGRSSFFHCEELVEVVIPPSVTEIRAYAFAYSAWEDEKLADKPYLVVNGILIAAGPLRGKVALPEGIRAVADYALARSKITGVVIPEGVERIGEGAFLSCKNLSSVEFPESLEYIGKDAFKDGQVALVSVYNGSSDQWESVEIEEGNDFVRGPGGVDPHLVEAVFSYDWSHLREEEFLFGYDEETHSLSLTDVRKTALYDVQIPEELTLSERFREIYGIEEEKLPVTKITADYWDEDSAFRNCYWVTSVSIPAGVKEISPYAFEGCSKLREIRYGGTREEWLSTGASSRILDGITIVCADDDAGGETELPKTAGDANTDGKVNVADAVAVLQFIANQKKYPLSAEGMNNADIDGEKGITGNDALAVQKIDAGLI